MVPLLQVLWTINSAIGVLLALVGLGIIINFRKVDFELLKARMFLGDTFYNMWVYSSIFGVFGILYGGLLTINDVFNLDIETLMEVSRGLFVVSFLVITNKWYTLIKLCQRD